MYHASKSGVPEERKEERSVRGIFDAVATVCVGNVPCERKAQVTPGAAGLEPEMIFLAFAGGIQNSGMHRLAARAVPESSTARLESEKSSLSIFWARIC